MFVKNGVYFSNSELWNKKDEWLKPEERVIFSPTIQIADGVRSVFGRSIIINSAVRSEEYNKRLSFVHHKARSVSPHCHKIAIDLSLRNADGSIWVSHNDMFDMLKLVAGGLNFPIRIGINSYKAKEQHLIHFDTAPLYLKKYPEVASKLPNEVQVAWSKELVW